MFKCKKKYKYNQICQFLKCFKEQITKLEKINKFNGFGICEELFPVFTTKNYVFTRFLSLKKYWKFATLKYPKENIWKLFSSI